VHVGWLFLSQTVLSRVDRSNEVATGGAPVHQTLLDKVGCILSVT
jgi:hypothetical protein